MRVKRLGIRLVGRPSNDGEGFFLGEELTTRDNKSQEDDSGSDSWETQSGSSSTGSDFLDSDSTDSDSDESSLTGRRRSLPKAQCNQELMELTLLPWRKKVNRRLHDISEVIPECHSLYELSFEALTDVDGERDWQWDYLFARTVQNFIACIPATVTTLTLDLIGSSCVSTGEECSEHLCLAIAKRLSSFENVRLRMRRICPLIFGGEAAQHVYKHGPTEEAAISALTAVMAKEALSTSPSRLKRMVIKLYLPYFPPYENGEQSDPCDHFERRSPLGFGMNAGGKAYAKTFPNMLSLIISHNQSEHSIYGFDCVRRAEFMVDAGLLAQKDDGGVWDDWKNNEDNIRYFPDPL
ncbi:uncharacterized protein KY384_008982 [Bacidia gigantensis]|uniref:uncharacterized protein n=1 Tax=Bacidia gigantensis TaxID=2732470 RepID=UPI001D03DC26|nr:uncharacterized protein KY384_008982 [Bacidia gigantensis]KAG8525338.1 hypothetical protein KY384_008982 [Bacidia gigantensis]